MFKIEVKGITKPIKNQNMASLSSTFHDLQESIKKSSTWTPSIILPSSHFKKDHGSAVNSNHVGSRNNNSTTNIDVIKLLASFSDNDQMATPSKYPGNAAFLIEGFSGVGAKDDVKAFVIHAAKLSGTALSTYSSKTGRSNHRLYELVLSCVKHKFHSGVNKFTFNDDNLQASGTIIEKEHQSSSIKGKSRSATQKLANTTTSNTAYHHPRNVKHHAPAASSRRPGQKNRTSSTLAASEDARCLFCLPTIFCSVIDAKWYISAELGKRSLEHTHHLPLDASDLRTHSMTVTQEVKDVATQLLEDGATNGVVINNIQSRYNVHLSYHQVHAYRNATINAIIDDQGKGGKPQKSSVDRLLSMFKKMKNVSYVYVKHHVSSGFVTYHKSMSECTTLCTSLTSEVVTWRKALCIEDTEDILVSFAWCHDEEKRQIVMFPEYLCTDMTFGLNKERRNLVTFVGVDGHNRAFTGFRCWMPSKQSVAYQWAIGTALPILLGKKVTLANRIICSDSEKALVDAVMTSINAPNGPLKNSKFRNDYYHLVVQPLNKIVGTVFQKSTTFHEVAGTVRHWMKSWFDYVLTEAEFAYSHNKLCYSYLPNNQGCGGLFVQQVQSLVKDVVKQISVVGNHHFKKTVTFGFIGSSIVEGANHSLKSGDFMIKPSMGLDKSTGNQVKQGEQQSKRRKIKMATELNRTMLWTRSKTKNFLTEYMEGVTVKNFDQRLHYVVCYNGNNVWWVMNKRIIDNVGNDGKCPSEQGHSKFDRVYVVTADHDGFLVCSCGYIYQYMAPCRHFMAVIDDEKFLLPSLFHIRWWKQYNYYFASDVGSLKVNKMHDRLVATYNFFLENGFDDNGVFKGCCMSDTGFLEMDRSVDLSSPTYKVMEAIRRYTNNDGPVQRNNTKFKKYLLGNEHAEDKYDEIGSHGFGLSLGHMDDDDTDAIDFSNVDVFSICSKRW